MNYCSNRERHTIIRIHLLTSRDRRRRTPSMPDESIGTLAKQQRQVDVYFPSVRQYREVDSFCLKTTLAFTRTSSISWIAGSATSS